MKKNLRRCFAVCAAMAMSFGAMDIKSAKAGSVTYNDYDVSLTMAVDRYVAVNLCDNTDVNDEVVAYASIETKEIKGTMSIEETAPASDTSEESLSEAVTEEIPSTEEVADNSSIPMAPYIDFSGKAIVAVNDNVNIRANATVNSNKVATIGSGGLMTVEEKGDEWSLVKSGNCEGYIKNEFIVFDDTAKQYAEKNLTKMAMINASSLRVRASASEDSECLTVVPNGETYRIVEQGDRWTLIEVDDSVSGYVRNDFLYLTYNTVSAVPAKTPDKEPEQTPSTQEPTTEDSTEAPADDQPAETTEDSEPSSGLGTEIVNYALQFVGNPYVYGGSSLTNGTDCSGFTMSVYANFGYSLPHSSRAQANCGTEVSLSALQPGDLIFYTNGGSTIGHVALYIGNGQVVHASTSKTGIIVSNAFYNTPCKAVRIIN